VTVGVAVGAVAVTVGLATLVDVLVAGTLVGVSVSTRRAAAGGLPPGRIATTMAMVANAANSPKNRYSMRYPPTQRS
jgi:hypothetical protein